MDQVVEYSTMQLFNFFTPVQVSSKIMPIIAGKLPEVNRWIVSEFILDKIIPIVGVRPYPLAELELLVSTLLIYQPTHICDWGTHVGKATRVFYESVKYFGLKAKIVSIDLPESVDHIEHPHADRGKLVKGLTGVKLLLGDGVSTAIKYLSGYSKKKVRPLFLLDGDHAYQSVKRELNLIGKNYKYAAIIIHDTFYQTSESNYNIGPYQAVSEFLAKNSRYNIVTSNFGLPGMTILLPNYEK